MNQVLSQPPSLWLPALRRAGGADIATKIGNHRFRATGITAYLNNGGTLEGRHHGEPRLHPHDAAL